MENNQKLILLLFLVTGIHSKLNAEAFAGLTLFAPSAANPIADNFTYLIDNESNIVHQWTHPARCASMPYLFPDSTMLYPCLASNIYMSVAAGGGRIIKYNWDGDILWDFNWSDINHIQHHDIEPLPNGNILILSNERKSLQDGIDMGRVDIEDEIWPDMIVEIQPFGTSGGDVIWEWHFWDHLIQDVDSTKMNFGVINDHPEKLDINVGHILGFGPTGVYSGDWMHSNSVHYNNELDQIIISCRRTSEFYIIDHSTNSDEASGNSGGNWGKGGDFLYRWGNPQNYGRGDSTTQVTFAQHSVNWVPQSYPGAGNILIYNNGFTQYIPDIQERSSIIEISAPMNEQNEYIINDNEPYGPQTFDWFYDGGDEFEFLSIIQGGAFRLPNGNTIITTTGNPTIFEVNPQGVIEWSILMGATGIARAQKYGYDYFTSQLLGDINLDNLVNVYDINMLVNFILGNDISPINGDLNSDSFINIIDIFMIIDIITGD